MLPHAKRNNCSMDISRALSVNQAQCQAMVVNGCNHGPSEAHLLSPTPLCNCLPHAPWAWRWNLLWLMDISKRGASRALISTWA